MSQSAECGATVVPRWYASLRKHGTVWVVAARMSYYLWLEAQWKRVADKLYVTWRTIVKGLDIRSSRLWRRGERTSWIGPLSQPCTSPRTCNELGDVCGPLPVVRAQKSLHMTPHALYSVCVGACTLVNEANAVVNGAVRVTFRVEMPVRSPAITDDRSAEFDPCIYNGHQSVGGSVRNGNEKRFTGLALNTAKHPLPLKRVVPMIFAPTELAFVYLDGLVTTADLLRAALHIHLHRLSAEQAPCRNCIGTEAMLLCTMWAGTRRTMSYVKYITSCKVSLLCWNHINHAW